MVSWHLAGGEERAELRIGADGALRRRRRPVGEPRRRALGRYPFGVSVLAETVFAGVTIPSELRAGWWWGTDRAAEGEFFRASLTAAVFH